MPMYPRLGFFLPPVKSWTSTRYDSSLADSESEHKFTRLMKRGWRGRECHQNRLRVPTTVASFLAGASYVDSTAQHAL